MKPKHLGLVLAGLVATAPLTAQQKTAAPQQHVRVQLPFLTPTPNLFLARSDRLQFGVELWQLRFEQINFVEQSFVLWIIAQSSEEFFALAFRVRVASPDCRDPLPRPSRAG
jgi:hypothetical protein